MKQIILVFCSVLCINTYAQDNPLKDTSWAQYWIPQFNFVFKGNIIASKIYEPDSTQIGCFRKTFIEVIDVI